MNTVLALLAIAGSLTAVVLALWWHRRSGQGRAQDRRPDADTSTAPLSDWQQVAQRTHHSQIEALREWMGEDHELVQQLRDPDTDPARGREPTDRHPDERLV